MFLTTASVSAMSLSTSSVRAEAKARGYTGVGWGAGGSSSRERRDAENFGSAMHLLELAHAEKMELQEKVKTIEKERDTATGSMQSMEKMLRDERCRASKLQDHVDVLRRELSQRQDRHRAEMEKAAQAPAALTKQLDQMIDNWQTERALRQNQRDQIAELQHKLQLAEGQLKAAKLCHEKIANQNMEAVTRAYNKEKEKLEQALKQKEREVATLQYKEEKRKAKKKSKKED